ncbi:MAG TPA: hypothetical protein ENF20_02075 [Candidatus Marinimicrobia bacterium]|nr:hypothetical protein [Candidatus Neomarinimicrobiota bacterium]
MARDGGGLLLEEGGKKFILEIPDCPEGVEEIIEYPSQASIEPLIPKVHHSDEFLSSKLVVFQEELDKKLGEKTFLEKEVRAVSDLVRLSSKYRTLMENILNENDPDEIEEIRESMQSVRSEIEPLMKQLGLRGSSLKILFNFEDFS